MSSLYEKMSIKDFSIDSIDISGIEEVVDALPKSGIVDANIAEKGLLHTLEGQNLCQERIVQVDRWIGKLESMKNKSWSEAALVKAKEAGYKTAKDKEWFAQADTDYIKSYNELILAKAAKKWLESKASYFLAWHYALKTFLKRDYSIENASGVGYNISQRNDSPFPSEANTDDSDFGADEYEWE